jgi:tetratricopeptide (TPR) repeat protein
VYTARLTVKAWNRALAAADTLIEMDPDKLRYHLQKQDVYLLTGRYEEAAAALEAAKDVLDEKDLACANVKMHAASGDPESGHEAWELCKDSENSSLRNAAEGWLALADGDLSLAVKRATDLGDRDQIQMALGLLRVEEGKLDAANNLLSALVEERPKAADARIHYAMVLSELGKSDEALTQLAVTYGDGWKDNVDAALTDAVLTARGESWIKSQLQEGAALLASLHKDAGADDSATSVCADAKALWPDAAAVTEACAAPTPE